MKLEQVLKAIDAVNSQDPVFEKTEQGERARNLVYGERMTAWLEKLNPSAEPCLQIAVRAQHLRRWEIPRSQYPEGKEGYLYWRKDLGKFHAEETGKIMGEYGFSQEEITRTKSLVRKEGIKRDPEAQLIEDCACLVFLENHFTEFAQKHNEEQLLDIVRKTWAKMGEKGKNAALKLNMNDEQKRIIGLALGA